MYLRYIDLAIALCYRMQLRQINVETAFPYADLEDDVFMAPPSSINVPNGYCLKILKSLYGLKHVPF